MPQTKVEKKFCSLSANHWRQNLASIIDKKLGMAEFQPLAKILEVKELRSKASASVKFDTISAGGQDAVLLGDGDA